MEGTHDACRCDIGVKVGSVGPRRVGRGQRLVVHGLIRPRKQGVPEGRELEEELPGVEATLTGGWQAEQQQKGELRWAGGSWVEARARASATVLRRCVTKALHGSCTFWEGIRREGKVGPEWETELDTPTDGYRGEGDVILGGCGVHVDEAYMQGTIFATGPGVPPRKEGVHAHHVWGGGVCGGGVYGGSILAGYSSASVPEGTHGLN